MWQPSPSLLARMLEHRRWRQLDQQARRRQHLQSRCRVGLDLQSLVELLSFFSLLMYLYSRWLVALLLKVVLALVVPSMGLVALGRQLERGALRWTIRFDRSQVRSPSSRWQ